MDIGKRIAYFRKQQGITTNKLANNAGLSQSFVRDVELSQKGITVDNLAILCDALGITLKDFFDEPKVSPDISNKELIKLINKLTHEQKEKLIEFLRIL